MSCIVISLLTTLCLYLVESVGRAASHSLQTAYILLRASYGESNCTYLHFVFQWCPPCRALLPELRKASKHLYGQLKFGTLDCTVHEGLCNMVSCRNLKKRKSVKITLFSSTWGSENGGRQCACLQ